MWKDSYLFYNFIIDDGILRGGAFDISKFVDVFFLVMLCLKMIKVNVVITCYCFKCYDKIQEMQNKK